MKNFRSFNMELGCKFHVRLHFALTLLFVSSSVGLTRKEGFVGCLFQTELCHVGKEWCYDDSFFGRCLPLNGDSYDLPTPLYHRTFGETELTALEAALTQLKRNGHTWADAVSQCVLQQVVDYFLGRDAGPPDVCSELDDNYKEVKNDDSANGQEDLLSDTYRRNKPQYQTPIYLSRNNLFNLFGTINDDSFVTDDNQETVLEDNSPANLYSWNLKKIASTPATNGSPSSTENLDIPLSNSEAGDFHNEEFSEKQLTKRLQKIFSSVKEPRSYDGSPSFDSEEADFDLALPGNIYTNPKFERQERLDVKKPGPWFTVNNFAFGSEEDDVDVATNIWNHSNESPDAEEEIDSLTEDISTNDNSSTNENRSEVPVKVERLMAIHHLLDELKDEQDEVASQDHALTELENLAVSNPPKMEKTFGRERKKAIEELSSTQLDGKVFLGQPVLPEHEIVETNYVFITVKGEFQSWSHGAELVNALSDLLRVPREVFNDIGVQGNQVTFQVLPGNSKGLNPSLVAAKADELRRKIKQLTGFEVVTTGIGDQTSVSSILYWGQENQQMLLTVGLCLLAAAILVAAVVVFLLRNRHIARLKLKDLTQSVDTEATRDYQDLCRARMAVKSTEPNKDSTKTPQTLFSRDSESSRSSTSSWCEEPVLTNMDISTGHMVLSYMEDHLRNKYRLDQEWLALCSYEAEPSTSVLVASKMENKEKNRFGDILPYDHSRVLLNAMANTTGSDYINASSITDHDPRHPAYIAAQSPVAASVADFWQMVWEQGSVVLVLLTRITENGQELCHKYWPEEGSHLYHIYEVHLVSEHIWCDDYLVRSFYLKNVRTGETRTVTQFHFQSWPENGVPSSTKALLEFRRKVNKSYRGRSCPIVVHCSDGAGRTGTYCLIDMVLHRMAKGAREIDIAATLEHLRDQRPHAVRNKQQFEFVLTAVAEEVHAILRALPQ